MKYKAEVHHRNIVHADYIFHNLTHPDQVARNVVKSIKGKIPPYVIIMIVNDVGESWRYSVMKKIDKKLYVRKLNKSNFIYTKDDIDMIFSGNMEIKW